MIINRRFESAHLEDLSDKLRVIFAPWVETAYNGDKEDFSVDLDSEVLVEESRRDNTSINFQTTRRHKSGKTT